MNPIVIVLIIIIAIPMLGALYELIGSFGDLSRHPSTGQLIDVGGYRLNVDVAGENTTEATVICDSGVGSFGIEWKLIQETLSEQTKVVTYDRAGNGWSDKALTPRTTQQLAEELHTLMQKADVQPPYVLVGHAFSAIHLRKFAELYPSEVAGTVFVDATNPKYMERADFDADKQLSSMRFPLLVKRIGLLRLIGKRVFWQYRKLPDAYQNAYVALALRSSDNVRKELEGLFRNPPNLPDTVGDIPLKVLTRSWLDLGEGKMPEADQEWQELQADLLTLSSNSQQTISEHGGRYLHVDDPEMVISAIQDIINQVSNQ